MKNYRRTREHERSVIDWDEFGSLPPPLKLSQIAGNVFFRPQTAVVRTEQSNSSCTMESEWLVAPHVSIEHAEYKGWHFIPDESVVYHFFRLDIKIAGTILCSGCGSSTTRPVEIAITTPIAHGKHTLYLVMPFKLKVFINAIRAAVAGGKLAKFVSENKEIMAYVLKFLDPMLVLVRNSAALMCASQMDVKKLQEQIQKYIDDHTRMLGPPSYELPMA